MQFVAHGRSVDAGRVTRALELGGTEKLGELAMDLIGDDHIDQLAAMWEGWRDNRRKDLFPFFRPPPDRSPRRT